MGAAIGVPLATSVACGLACGTLGQAGDLFQSLLTAAADAIGCANEGQASLKVVADHIRSCSFLIADGVIDEVLGRFRATGSPPTFMEGLRVRGVTLPQDLFDPAGGGMA